MRGGRDDCCKNCDCKQGSSSVQTLMPANAPQAPSDDSRSTEPLRKLGKETVFLRCLRLPPCRLPRRFNENLNACTGCHGCAPSPAVRDAAAVRPPYSGHLSLLAGRAKHCNAINALRQRAARSEGSAGFVLCGSRPAVTCRRTCVRAAIRRMCEAGWGWLWG